MNFKRRPRLAGILLFVFSLLFLNCNTWTPVRPTAVSDQQMKTPLPRLTATSAPTISVSPQAPVATNAQPTHTSSGDLNNAEPAGCLTAQAQSDLGDAKGMLAYADRLLGLPHPLAARKMTGARNEYTGKSTLNTSVMMFSVADVQNEYLLQHMLNTLQVAGFVTWLRKSPELGLHILAIPLIGAPSGGSPAGDWSPYIQAYWQDRHSLPSGDRYVQTALKLPPCGWMVSQGWAPHVDAAAWFKDPSGWPEYASAASSYLADSDKAAADVAHRIGWLGNGGREGPYTMCGPLVWSIMNDAGALPPDRGGWSDGPRAFWLAKPRENGRPWSLFPADLGQVHAFRQPLGSFDFQTFPLYPGDFFYSYSSGDGFDHMFMVTEVDAQGNVYTVTNLIHMLPQKTSTIERVLLLNLNDPTVGIARNQWANDRVNGRTGHAGFDVFRWAWMEKDITGQAASYTVQPGDMLGLIAERWKTPAELIARYNGIRPGAALLPGQVLRIPPNENLGR